MHIEPPVSSNSVANKVNLLSFYALTHALEMEVLNATRGRCAGKSALFYKRPNLARLSRS
jgi:hypothetical protein